MKKSLIGMIGGLVLGLTACTGGLNTAPPVIGTGGSDGTVTVTRTKNKDTGEITYTTEYKAAEFTFNAFQGSPGGRITGFKITSSKLAGQELIDPKKPDTREAINTFVQSGFTCTPAPAATQNCDNPTTRSPANGAESGKILLVAGAELAAYMISNNLPATQFYNIVFIAKDTALNDFEVQSKGMRIVGTFNSK